MGVAHRGHSRVVMEVFFCETGKMGEAVGGEFGESIRSSFRDQKGVCCCLLRIFLSKLCGEFKFPRELEALGKQMAGGYQKENLTGEGENKCSTRLANGGIEARGRMLGCFLGDWEKVQFQQ